jgi:hypothetical protein
VVVLIVCGILAACGKGKEVLPGRWEMDMEKTLAQYSEVPTGYGTMSLTEFRNYLRGELAGRTYKFDTKKARPSDWGGYQNFDGTVQMRDKNGLRYWGAWQSATNQASSYKLFLYGINSGAMYLPHGTAHLGTNQVVWTGFGLPDDKPAFLRRK